MKKDLTKGNIKKHYFTYLFATFGSAMISVVYCMVDSAAVGHYQGPSGTATLSILMPIWTIIYAMGLLVGIGSSISYGIYKGQRKPDKANSYFTLSIIVMGIISVICQVGICVFEEELLRLFGADNTLLPLAKEYLIPVKIAIPVFPFTQVFSAFLRNDNAPSLATTAVICGAVFNIVGDIIFIFSMDMGLFGAGLASAIGPTITLLVMCAHFFRKSNTLKFTTVYNWLHKVRRLLVNGFSAFVSDISIGIVIMLFNRQIMKYFGSDALAVFGVIGQATTFIQCATYGVGQAAQPLLSNNFGANLKHRVKETNRYGIATTVMIGAVCTLAIVSIPKAIVNVFMSPTKSVMEIAPKIMRIYAISYLALPLNVYSTYYFQSVIESRTAFIVSMARGFVLCAILVHVMPLVLGSASIWWVMPITEISTLVYIIIKMRKMEAVQ